MDENTTAVANLLTPQQAWNRLQEHKSVYYAPYSAVYSGTPLELNMTAKHKTFWRRNGKQKIHIPLAADIAATSSDLMFGEDPSITVVGADEKPDEKAQKRMEKIERANCFHALMCESCESASALGDVYLKCAWDAALSKCPRILLVQGDMAWPEYRLGMPQAIHFFTEYSYEYFKNGTVSKVIRAYELYTPGRIVTKLFMGTKVNLGNELSPEQCAQYGIEPDIETGVSEMLAVHIPNIRPNRLFRNTYMGRSDFDGLRDMMDSLDEAYSSWMRDIRLAKARLIVPAEFLRRKVNDMFDGDNCPPTFEFDEDVETLVALDVNADYGKDAAKITPSQFAIRAEEHAKTCSDLYRQIVQGAGYSPQTFGIDIQGMAQSGTALHIREKKSFSTCAKKRSYWQDALENLLTAVVHLDAKVFSGEGSSDAAHVHVQFSDVFAADTATLAQTLTLLTSAQAASTEVKVKMLHPDWDEKQIKEEIARVVKEYAIGLTAADPAMGDYYDSDDDDGNTEDNPTDNNEQDDE